MAKHTQLLIQITLCKKIITDIIPMQSLVITDEGFDAIKQFNLIKTNIDAETITEKLCIHKSNVNAELNNIYENTSIDKNGLDTILDFIITNKLFILCDSQGTWLRQLFNIPCIRDNYPNK